MLDNSIYISIIECLIGLTLSIVIFAYARSAQHQRQISFISSTIIAGTLFYSRIAIYFDPKLKLFGVLLALLVLIGGLVGGVIGVLLPKTSVGLTLGFFVALLVCSIIISFDAIQGTGELFIIFGMFFLIAMSVSVYLAQKFEKICARIRSALVVGFVFGLAVDSLVPGTALRRTFFSIMLMSSEQLCTPNSSHGCHVVPLMVLWVVSSLGFVIFNLYEVGALKRIMWRSSSRGRNRTHYMQLSSSNDDNGSIKIGNSNAITEKNDVKKQLSLKQRTFSYPDSLESNYFDPDNIPEAMVPYAETIFLVVQQLQPLHGFQVDNARNQAEHLLMLVYNETLASDDMVSRPAQRLHAALFRNYRKWCTRLGVPSNLVMDNSGQKSFDHLIEDNLLLLLIWGEAANLKHLPECICFLLHKTLEEHLIMKQRASSFAAAGNTSSSPLPKRYPGFYLDMVVTPLYEVVAKALSSSDDSRNYDDFNEFFWSPTCLRYRLHEMSNLDTMDSVEGQHQHTKYIRLSNGFENSSTDEDNETEQTNIADALQHATKTYIEKRSWLHPLLSMSRIFEWHAVTFTLLAVWSYSNILQWTYAFTFQVGSFIFWEITFFSLLWTALEVWTLFPDVKISDPSVAGYLLRLLVGLLILTYQSVYYHWSFVNDNDTVLDDIQLYKTVHDSYHKNEDYMQFWWWQYIWISIIACSIYFLESIICWIPGIVTALMTWENDLFQAFLSIVYPFSQLYVGKNMYISQKEVFIYIFYWLTLLTFKIWFGYRYIVSPVCSPSLELYDDYMNYYGGPEQFSFMKTSFLIFFWWFPHFLVYLIDLSIWYSVWASAVGGFIALTDRQGAIRDSESFRKHFLRAPLAFCQRMMPVESELWDSSNMHISTTSLQDLTIRVPTKSEPKSNNKSQNNPSQNKEVSKKKFYASAADLTNVFSTDGVPSNQAQRPSTYQSSGILDQEQGIPSDTRYGNFGSSALESMNDILDSNNQRWVVFAKVFNEIVLQMRKTDLINNTERDILLFSYFEWLPKSTYLPLFQTAGCVSVVAVSFKETSAEYLREKDKHNKMVLVEDFIKGLGISGIQAVEEVWELSGWVLKKMLGLHHSKDIERVLNVLGSWGAAHDLFRHMDGANIDKVLQHIANIVGILKGIIPKRMKHPVVTPDYLLQSEQQNKFKENPTFKNNFESDSTSKVAGGRIKKSVSTGFLASLQEEFNQPDQHQKHENIQGDFQKLRPFRKDAVLQDGTRDKIREELRGLFNNLRGSLKIKSGVTPEGQDIIDRIVFILMLENGFIWDDTYASAQIDEIATDKRLPDVLKKLNGLLKLRKSNLELKSVEARRRLNFFMTTLFMDMPNVPSMRYCKEYTCITPYYGEDILLSTNTLAERNTDGVSTLLYLQTLYRDDWRNFMERRGIKDDQEVWNKAHIQEVRMWASYRAQTLFRTVEGMMYSEAAVRLLAELEQLDHDEIQLLSKLKFNYVVAAQIYGKQRKSMDSKADDIDFLLARHPNLRVAYIDSFRINRAGDMAYYSVLVKHDQESAKAQGNHSVKEVYRIKLPGNPVLGEGKPENQNHAVIFTRGRFLQAIDMNQDGYFEESLKMRNLLEEFQSGCAILGFREFIFTGTVSSVANFMAMQELSFVTLGQRVLNQPLRIRQHYGHPDLFNKIFVMTEGGMSKASKGINLSEDVFAGYNATIRGHSVQFKEYVQVGKGRDVGLQQTYKFEAKLSQGNAEQSLSRDLARICDRLDFFRLMSFYYGGIGHYMANTMVMFTLVVVIYTMICLAVYNEEGVNGRPMHPEGVLQMLLAGMGLLQTLPLMVTLTVEKGVWQMSSEILFMILSGGPLYFIFHIQTKSFYFSQTLMAGGAIYRPTGRGFVTRHSPFDENYRFFVGSHIYLGFEIFVSLILFALYSTTKQYGGLTWALWLTAASFLFGPFWFNPLSFTWKHLSEDYITWMHWMSERGGNAEQSWEAWWREENSVYTRLSTSWKIFLAIQKCAVWIFLSIGIAGKKFFASNQEKQKLGILVVIMLVYILGQHYIAKYEKYWVYAARRFTSLLLSTAVLLATIAMIAVNPVSIKYLVSLYYFASAVSFMLLLNGALPQVIHLYKVHDYLVGHTIFCFLAILTILQIGYLQTWLLYHNALNQGVEIEDILDYARRTRERAAAENESETVHELRAQLAEQQQLLKQILSNNNKVNVELTNIHDKKNTGYGSITNNNQINKDKNEINNNNNTHRTDNNNNTQRVIDSNNDSFLFSQPTHFPSRE